jgi:uncharacterized FAD-dependent dehydrogenase
MAFEGVVIATGRFGGRDLATMVGSDFDVAELRYEIGVRIEHRNSVGFLREKKSPDVKFMLCEEEVEVRTFCTCRSGEVWMIPYGQVSALSGRSDGPPTGYSNFGLLPRFSGPSCGKGRMAWEHFLAAANSHDAYWEPLREFLGDGPGVSMPADDRPWYPRERFAKGEIGKLLTPEVASIIKGSLRALIAHYPDLDAPDTMCLFPAIEGVGLYPRVNDALRVKDERIWCCGDVAGSFRGLIPALVSGHFAGAQAAAALAQDDSARRAAA